MDASWSENINGQFLLESIQITQLTPEYFEEAVTLYNNIFFATENLSKTMKIADDSEALKETRELTEAAARHGIATIALDTKNNKVVAVFLGGIMTKGHTLYENFSKKWKTPKARQYAAINARIDSLFDVFEYFQVNSVLDIVGATTLPEYRCKGIGMQVVVAGLKLARQRLKENHDGGFPSLVIGVSTCHTTQSFNKLMGFQTLKEINFNEFEFDNLDFSDIIRSGTDKIQISYLKLTED